MRRLFALLALATLLPGAAAAQRTCPNGATAVGDYGFAAVNARVLLSERDPEDDARTRIRFGTEIVVQELQSGSAGDGVFRPGDVIIAIDDLPVTTFDGSRRITHPPIDRPVRFLIRRDGVETRLTVTPRESCMTLFGPALVPREHRATPIPPGRYVQVGDAGGWLGIRFECARCTGEADTYREQLLITTRPRVLEVAAGSPAAHAGVRPGDILVRVDDHPVPGPAAHLRMGTLVPGQSVRLRFLRADTPVDLTLTPVPLPR